MSGYIGYSRSVNSQRAMDEGKMTATDFAKWLRKWKKFKGCNSSDVAAVLSPCEWHHTSKHYNITNYYKPTDLLESSTRCQLVERIKTRKAAKTGELLELFKRQASEKGLKIVDYKTGTVHAVNEKGVSEGRCRTQDFIFTGFKAGIEWN